MERGVGGGMNDRRRSLTDAIEILANLVRTIHLRRTLSSVRADPHLNFWRVIYGNLTDMAVLEWCKLFGSDDEKNQPVHWKNMASDPEQFHKDMLSRLKIYDSKWRSYWTDIKRYRDQSVAHHDHRRVEIRSYPSFDLALQSAYFYYDFLISELRKMGVDQHPKDLQSYGEAFAAECHDIGKAAFDATNSFRERVG
jgi:hypothetical protein